MLRDRDGPGKIKEPDDSSQAADPGLHVALRYNRSSPSSSTGIHLTSGFPCRQTEPRHLFCTRRHNRLMLQCPVDPAWFCPPSNSWRTFHRLFFLPAGCCQPTLLDLSDTQNLVNNLLVLRQRETYQIARLAVSRSTPCDPPPSVPLVLQQVNREHGSRATDAYRRLHGARASLKGSASGAQNPRYACVANLRRRRTCRPRAHFS